MAVNPISMNKISQNMMLTANSPTDVKTKDIMNQITNKQQSLSRLSSDSEMSAEEKAKERQEIQKQIAELNRKLRMLRMEKKEETRELEKEEEKKLTLEEKTKKEVSAAKKEEDDNSEKIEKQQEKAGISPQSVKEILEAGAALQRERILQNVEQNEKAEQNILEAEIKMDKLYGTDTSGKKEKLHSLMEAGKNKVQIEEIPQKQSVKPQNIQGKIVIREDAIVW